MSVAAAIVDGPLPPVVAPGPPAGAGAAVVFEGVVRPLEGDATITALDYSTYDPMALKQLRELAEDVCRLYGLAAIHVLHSRGRVPVGACSFRLTVHSAHRKEALAAMDEFIDRLKRDVPIWKKAVL